MKEADFCQMGLRELNNWESSHIDGGSWIVFVAGAIAGGIIYDAWKSGAKAYVKACMNGTIDPSVRPYR